MNQNELYGLERLPAHMRPSVEAWIHRGFPHPKNMGGFFRAVLSDSLFEAFAYADDENAKAMREWCRFFHNEAPSQCFGTMEKILAWHKRGGLSGIAQVEDAQ